MLNISICLPEIVIGKLFTPETLPSPRLINKFVMKKKDLFSMLSINKLMICFLSKENFCIPEMLFNNLDNYLRHTLKLNPEA